MRLGAQNIGEEAQRNVEHVLDLQQRSFQRQLAGIYLRDRTANRENDGLRSDLRHDAIAGAIERQSKGLDRAAHGHVKQIALETGPGIER